MDKLKPSYWIRWWTSKPKKERQRLTSFLPLLMYSTVFGYVIYLSVLNSVNRNNTGTAVKNWWGGDRQEIIDLKAKQKIEIQASFEAVRKRVSGGR